MRGARAQQAARRPRGPGEYGVEKIVRDPRAHRILEGTDETMRVTTAGDMTGAFG
ncbi:hypothetical protein [Streptomyces sp. MJP52]|uniref:hypothetical protein n=1 Tax=Streptomyces sp. MJP52 TaxID=2940555 RepID=UPI002473F7A8|nr:hypothetical protein [Streptomyces sp. MJP52]MDH6223826.1 alkylation response protein AidB-like acyl-CoA dehydrogenase [Streptomyces sp. MJP52]